VQCSHDENDAKRRICFEVNADGDDARIKVNLVKNSIVCALKRSLFHQRAGFNQPFQEQAKGRDSRNS